MGIDLSGVQVFVAQNLLEGADVHAVLEHERGGSVAELVWGVLGAVQSGHSQVFFHQLFHGGLADALTALADEEGVFVDDADGTPGGQVVAQGGAAGVVEVEDALLVALAQNAELVVPQVGEVEADQLGDPQAAV